MCSINTIDIFIIMDRNASLINSIFDNKKTYGMFYELILQNKIERILEKLYPVELAARYTRRKEFKVFIIHVISASHI